ncbi:5-(carboxyamino)imidazole ribonucleotide synthase [Actinomarinicola tropica]|uniref:N5-carboxyaminoimidazole ribonucleotide synthase n=1 Tax=Actinomarinicola tropica TaxID=2789776 RepID=A0A5Q2RM41_9ACTN|nr:5-(carboxyamino)imidazole ribonucleotide synthase [Actinomarinicola tropica]QGG94930.1 5-(carboxyamino)imidazole ribonucleotide synthase [Actinomarinicola tropica]
MSTAPRSDEATTPPTIGMVGGGQLARMSHQAAIALGVHLRVLAASVDDAAALVSPAKALGDPGDPEDLRRFADGVDVVTFDHELVDLDALAAIERDGLAATRPSAEALRFATDKAHQRRRFAAAGLPLPRHRTTTDVDEARRAAGELGWPVVVKTARGGYDGRGVWVLADEAQLDELLHDLTTDAGLAEVIVEEAVSIVREMAVVVVRSPDGTERSYPVTETVQVDGICRETITPARVPEDVAAEARRIAEQAAEVAGAVGLIAVELFHDGEAVTINEVATRPHNSGHWSIEGAVTSQFENHLRAVAGLPLGDTQQLAPVVVSANVLGHADGRDPVQHLAGALAVPGAHVHLYGKGPRPGRKLGHVTVLADSLDDARQRARSAVAALGDPVPEVD